MELRILRYFAEVATRGNFTAAAEALGLTQPTLSKQIMDFEEELGKKTVHPWAVTYRVNRSW